MRYVGKLTIDFETRSEISLKDHGAWVYSRHPSTSVLCVAWSDGFFESGQWRRGDPPPRALFSLIRSHVVEAHNAFFEYCIWLNVCVARMEWPAVDDDRWRCSMATARANGLPGGLADAGHVAGLSVVKDEKEGRWSMLKLSKPRKATKNDDSKWHEGEDDWLKMLEYNRRDVEAEVALSEHCVGLLDAELEVWRASERMNRRGFGVDVEGCRRAVMMAGEHALRLTREFQRITGLETAGQRAKFITWLNQMGISVSNTQADTLDDVLENRVEGKNPDVYRAIEIVRALGRSSIKKYRALLDYADRDARARGCFIYHGAHTGRWAGSGPQPQNFKRDCPWDMDEAWRAINEGSLDLIELWYGDPLTFLSEVTRGSICAPPGRQYYAGDYAQIEPRVLFWQAGETRGLQAFRDEEDIYLDMASTIYGRKVIRSKENEQKRWLGKKAILSFGYGSGFVKFLVSCREEGVSFSRQQICELVPTRERNALLSWILDSGWKMVKKQIPGATRADAEQLVLTKYVVDKYRERFRQTVVKLWTDMENAFRQAIREPGRKFKAGKVSYVLLGRVMTCQLPSGRPMRYLDPREDESGDLSHGQWSEGRWQRVKTYGGKLVENATQAISRDVMADGILRLEASGTYKNVVMTVHDDCIAETPEHVGDLNEFLGILATPPAWAPDLPVKADGWVGKRYHK